MEQELSAFSFLTNQMQSALEEMEAQNYGNAKRILQNALESFEEYDLVFPFPAHQ